MVDGGLCQSKKLTIELRGLVRLGIDEIALRKGHKDFVVVFVDLDRNRLIGMAASRKHADIEKVLDSWGQTVLDGIREVSIDLSGNYRGLVRKRLPQAAIVADRFHVMKLVNQELNQTRNRVLRHPTELPEGLTLEQFQAVLKPSKYALLKPEDSLIDKQLAQLAEVKAVSPLLANMHQQKEAFRHLFDATSSTEGMLALMDWLADARETFQESVATICRWFDEISQYFEHRTTSGAVEGINNRLKLIKRSGYGFRNFARFRLRCLICWHLTLGFA